MRSQGGPITADAYLVFYSEFSQGPFLFHSYTVDTTYTDIGVLSSAPAMFYQVETYIGPISLLAAIPQRITREQFVGRLSAR